MDPLFSWLPSCSYSIYIYDLRFSWTLPILATCWVLLLTQWKVRYWSSCWVQHNVIRNSQWYIETAISEYQPPQSSPFVLSRTREFYSWCQGNLLSPHLFNLTLISPYMAEAVTRPGFEWSWQTPTGHAEHLVALLMIEIRLIGQELAGLCLSCIVLMKIYMGSLPVL